MELLFLGTGAGIPAKHRNVSSIAIQLLQERGTTWLVDCGEATQHQILHTSIKPRRIEKIFITHLHGDHIYGLPGLLGSRSFQDGQSALTVYGPSGIKEFISVTLSVSQTHVRYPLKIVEVEEGIIFEDDTFKVECQLLEHGIPSYGYRITEKSLPGILLVDKLKEVGIKPGPIYQKIKQGEQVELENGTVINGADFVGPPKKGKVIVILGDTRICKKSIELASHADVLVHEATFAGNDEQLAYDYFHSTAKQAAEVAKRANVKQLILTHISSRYQADSIQLLVHEAKEIFEQTEVAEDLKMIPIPN
ncbi:ribonuclease Z [Metabacillus iocasae]|uniref:Ribonuclease Z n=1 Tax=Priestia iocasae TaxID=2291674 RepID=A0ABS2QSW9_9BACI|nr:ribonuclease Z [Metabacillus iocasae]MBM7701629.1 ribonuclease Z [Metabacillus iocasae]